MVFEARQKFLSFQRNVKLKKYLDKDFFEKNY